MHNILDSSRFPSLSPSPFKSAEPIPSVIVLPPDSGHNTSASNTPFALNLKVSARQSNAFSVQWDKPKNNSTYTVLIDSVTIVSELLTNEFTATGLKPGTRYQLEVQVFERYGSQSTQIAKGSIEITTLSNGVSNGILGGGGGGVFINPAEGSSEPVPTATPFPLVEIPLQWTVEPEGQMLIPQAPAVGSDGAVYFGLFPATLLGYDYTGTSIFQTTLAGTPKTSPVLDNRGYLYLGTWPGGIQIFTTLGRYQSSLGMDDEDPVSIALSNDQETLYATSEQGSVWAWSLQTYELLWKRKIESRLVTQLIWNKGCLYLGGASGIWYSLDAFSGEIQWQFRGSGLQMSGYPLIDNLLIFLPQDNGHIYALDHKGFQLWLFQAGSPLVGSPIQDQARNLYFVTKNGYLNALSSTGKLKWKTALADATGQSSPVMDQQGFIYVASERYLQAFDSEGRLRAKFLLEENIKGSLTMSEQGFIYVLGVSGRLRVYESLGGGLPKKGWPKVQRNAENQGYYQND